MKKLIVTLALATVAVGVYAQGTVNFNNRVTGTLITHVYAPQVGNPTEAITGQSSTDFPAGSTLYTGAALSGNNFYAQLLAAPGTNVASASLVAASSAPTTFRTGTGAGFVAASTATLAGVPLDAPWATIQMVAWDNTSGLYGTWALASVAWQQGLINAGMSLPINVAQIGGVFNTAPNLVGLQSFNLYAVPEPSTFALAGLGLAGLLIFRRRK